MSTTIEMDVRLDCPTWAAALPKSAEGFIGRLAAHALEAVELPDGVVELAVILSDNAAVRVLNRDWRGQDKPTNVLSFASLDDAEAPLPDGAPLMLGDVILAYETVVAEARDQGKKFEDHVAHLVIHGVLHLLGYDHLEPDEAAEMESLETTLLAALGITDPYQEDD